MISIPISNSCGHKSWFKLRTFAARSPWILSFLAFGHFRITLGIRFCEHRLRRFATGIYFNGLLYFSPRPLKHHKSLNCICTAVGLLFHGSCCMVQFEPMAGTPAALECCRCLLPFIWRRTAASTATQKVRKMSFGISWGRVLKPFWPRCSPGSRADFHGDHGERV